MNQQSIDTIIILVITLIVLIVIAAALIGPFGRILS